MSIKSTLTTLLSFKTDAKAHMRPFFTTLMSLYESRKIYKAVSAINIARKLSSSSPASQKKGLEMLEQSKDNIIPVPLLVQLENSGKRIKENEEKKKKEEEKNKKMYTKLHTYFIKGDVTFTTQYEKGSSSWEKKRTIYNNSGTVEAATREAAMNEWMGGEISLIENVDVYNKSRTVERINVTQCIQAPESSKGFALAYAMFMKAADAVSYDFIPADAKNLKNEGFCVPDQFIATYGPDPKNPKKRCIPTLNLQRFTELCREVRGEAAVVRVCKENKALDWMPGDDADDEEFEAEKNEYSFCNIVIKTKPRGWSLEDGVTPQMLCEICKILGISHYALDITQKCFMKHIAPHQNYPALIYYAVNDHMYHITQPEVAKKLVERAKDDECKISSSALKNEYAAADKVNPFTQTIHENISVKNLIEYRDCVVIYTERNDLSDLVEEIIATYNYIPKFIMKKCFIVRIQFNFESRNITLSTDPNDRDDINYKNVKELCEKLKLEFKNQSFAVLIADAKARFLENSGKRHYFNKEERTEIWKQCGKKCKQCTKTVTAKAYHIDHILALANGGTNEPENIQVLCVACHADKTKAEREHGYVKMVDTESSFNAITNDIFQSELCSSYAFIEKIMDDEKVKAIMRDINAKKIYHMDIVKCRKNILYFQKNKYPVFSVMDKPEPYNGERVPGLYYVETAQHFPMRGNGWYYAPMVEYALTAGLIAQSEIKYVIKSSLTVEFDYFNSFIDYIYDTIPEFAKLAINGMIGCFKPKIRENMKSLGITASANEAFYLYLSHNCNFIDVKTIQGTDYYNVCHQYTTKKEESEAPLYHMIVDMEAIEQHKLMKRIESKGGVAIDLNTDCVSCVFPNDECLFDVEEYFYDAEETLPNYKLETKEARVEINMKYDKNEVKKDKVLYERLRLEKLANMNRSAKYEHRETKWTEYEDVADNDFKPLVEMITANKQSIHIDGRAGVGKSSLVKELQKQLESLGKHSISLAPTNKAARIIKGKTIHKFIAENTQERLRTMKCDVVFIDEISMVSERFYKFFLVLKQMRPDIQFIISGDFEQLEPVCDRIGECDYKGSPALHQLCDGRRLNLTNCRRANRELFDLCDPKTIHQVKASQFPSKFMARHICFTNEKRKQVNEKMMNDFIEKAQEYQRAKKQAAPKMIVIKKSTSDVNSQEMKLIAGMPIIAKRTCANEDNNFANNETFTIKTVDPEFITIIDEDQGLQQISTAEFVDSFYVAFCITTHKSQGESYRHAYTIHEWPLFSNRMKYVALSRATDKKYINIIQ